MLASMTRILFVLNILALGSAAAAPTVQFNRDIRPILADTCFHCHGPDPGSRKAKLRLDTEAGFFAQRDDGPTVVKGNAEKSPLYQRLITTDEDEIMPPRKEQTSTPPSPTKMPSSKPKPVRCEVIKPTP